MADRDKPETDGWNAATDKLIALTESGKLNWSPRHDFDRSYPETEVSRPAFLAEVSGRLILVYEYRYKHFLDADEWVWDRDISIEFVGPEPDLDPLWTWPSPRGRFRLIEAIRFRNARADEFLHEFLASAADTSAP